MAESRARLFQVRAWDQLYENNRSRELGTTTWFPIPNDLSAYGYVELVTHAEGPAHFGVRNALLMVASKAKPRGLPSNEYQSAARSPAPNAEASDGMGQSRKALPQVERLPGENHRDRVLSQDEEERYLDATVQIGESIEAAYRAALQGIRALRRSEQPIEPEDPFLLRDVATILLDCGVRPEEF